MECAVCRWRASSSTPSESCGEVAQKRRAWVLSGAEMLISAVADVRVRHLLLHTIRVLLAIRVLRRSGRALALSWSAPASLRVFALVHLAPSSPYDGVTQIALGRARCGGGDAQSQGERSSGQHARCRVACKAGASAAVARVAHRPAAARQRGGKANRWVCRASVLLLSALLIELRVHAIRYE